MWLLRRKAASSEANGEVLPAAAIPMRRIEITVDRQWITRFARRPVDDSGGAGDDEKREPERRLPEPPD